jgi:DNA primase
MSFPRQFIDNIKSRVSITEIVGRKVALKPKGRGEFTGLCCFHKEKTPSFSVSETKGFYHCFGCGAHGDIVTFLIESEGFQYMEAVKLLAGMAGLQMPERENVEEYKKQEIIRLSQLEILEKVTRWFEGQLLSNNSYSAREYISNRGINSELARKFRIGYAPQNSNFIAAMKAEGVTVADLTQVGLLILPESGREPYPRFRDRIMFPICAENGKVIAFGGRILGEGMPKYLNSPETETFSKGRILYNLNNARNLAFESGKILVVEGYMDVIALHNAGYTNVVAPLGTSITQDHLVKLWQIADAPILCLDGDAAGGRAMARAAELCLPLLKPGKTLKFIRFPEGLDPDDYLAQKGSAEFKNLINNTISLESALWAIASEGMTAKTPDSKAKAEKQIMELINKITDPTVKIHYRDHFRQVLFNERRGAKTQPKVVSNTGKLVSTMGFDPKDQNAKQILFLAINHPDLLHKVPDAEECLMDLTFQEHGYSEIRDIVLGHLASNSELNLKEYLESHGFANYMSVLEKSHFINPACKEGSKESLARGVLQYLISAWYSVKIEQDFQLFLSSNAAEDTERLTEMQKQHEEMKKLVISRKMEYEALLND